MQTRSDEFDKAEEKAEAGEASQAVEAAEAAEAVEDEQAGAAETDAEALRQRLSELEAENTDVKDRLLRLAADMENLRRRTERDVADAKRYAVSAFATEILNVSDNLRRAIEAAPVEGERDGVLSDVLAGIEMTERELHNTLEKHGVRRIEAAGERFDPKLHEAMFQIETGDAAPGTVVQVVQEGYTIGDRTLRPARVGVAQGGPRRANGEAEGERS